MSSRLRNRTILPLALLLIAAGGIGSVQIIRVYGGAVNSLNRSLKILSADADLRQRILVMEIAGRTSEVSQSSQRTSWLERYDSEFQQRIKEMLAVVSKTSPSYSNIKKLEELANSPLSQGEGTQSELSRRFVMINQQLDQIDFNENAMVKQYNEFIGRYARLFTYLVLLTTFGSVALLALFWYLLNRENEIRNRTEQKLRQAREAAVVASKMKSQFLATVSHEIRTPLNGIIGLTDLLTRRNLPAAEKKLVETLHKSGLSLIRIVSDILDFSKIEAGKFDLEYTTLHILEWAESSFALYREKASNKGIEFVVEVMEGTPEAWVADPVRLSQVLNNLISNAIKFTSSGRVIVRIGSQVVGNEDLYVEVQDDGPGLSDVQIAQLFQPFNQVHLKGAETEESTGLGLSISKSLLDKMHGEIGVSSEVNRGSLFWFRVPLERASEVRIQGTVYSSSAMIPRTKRRSDSADSALDLDKRAPQILIAEDNPTNQYLLVELVRELGGQPTVVSNGQQAIESFNSGVEWDLVIMDIRMPVVDGLLATREIRNIEKSLGRHTPIVALTANARDKDREQCLAAGMDDFMSKPVVRADIERVFKKWLDMGSESEDEFNTQVLNRVRTVFKENLPKSLEQIQTSKSVKDLGFYAHRLRSSAAMLGYDDLASACETMESLAESSNVVNLKDQKSDKIQETLSVLLFEGQKVEQDLQEFQAFNR